MTGTDSDLTRSAKSRGKFTEKARPRAVSGVQKIERSQFDRGHDTTQQFRQEGKWKWRASRNLLRESKSSRISSVIGHLSRNAEVYELHLWRGDVEPESNRYVFPVLPSKIHVWELTNEVDREGFLVLRYHTLRSLRFHDVSNLKLDGFNYQNAIAELSIAVQTPPQGAPNLFAVHFAPAFGMACSFQCFRS